MWILMGKSLALYRNNFLLPKFFWLKMQKIHFFKKNGFERVFFKKNKMI